MKRKFLSLVLAICMVIGTITPLMAGEITILTPRMGEENTTPKEEKGDIIVLDPILSEPETPEVIEDEKSKKEPKDNSFIFNIFKGTYVNINRWRIFSEF